MLGVESTKLIPYCQIPPFSEMKKSFEADNLEHPSGSKPVKTAFTLSIYS